MNNRNNITNFICSCYCQFCKNNRCNVDEIMCKYENNYLSFSQMEEVNEFKLDRASCKNHMSDEGFTMFVHKIEIHYKNGDVMRKEGWFSAKSISELWDEDVENVEILFTDV